MKAKDVILEDVFSCMEQGLVVIDAEGKFVFLNPAAKDILGDEFLAGEQTIFNMPWKGEYKIKLERIFKKILEGEDELEGKKELVKDEKKMLQYSFSRITKNNEQRGILLIINDITKMVEDDKKKLEFISIVSHEMKTPLTSIRGFSELLLMKNYNESKQKEFLKHINTQSVRLGELVNDFLNISKIEAGKLTLKKEPCELESVIDSCTAMFSMQEEHKFDVILEENLPLAFADKNKLKQVLINLISNAVKYSPEGGKVVVKAQKEGEFILVSVSDEGIGIPQDQLPNLFSQFFRVRSSKTASISGTGLGLFITKSIIEMHSGKIWVKSEEGKGTIFYFTVPIAKET